MHDMTPHRDDEMLLSSSKTNVRHPNKQLLKGKDNRYLHETMGETHDITNSMSPSSSRSYKDRDHSERTHLPSIAYPPSYRNNPTCRMALPHGSDIPVPGPSLDARPLAPTKGRQDRDCASLASAKRVIGPGKVTLYMTQTGLSILRSRSPRDPSQSLDKLSMSGHRKHIDTRYHKTRPREDAPKDNKSEAANSVKVSQRMTLDQRLANSENEEGLSTNDTDGRTVNKVDPRILLRMHKYLPEESAPQLKIGQPNRPSFHVLPLKPVLPPIGGRSKADRRTKMRGEKRGKKNRKSLDAKRREQEDAWRAKCIAEDPKLETFLQSVESVRRGATCIELDKFDHNGTLVQFAESMVVLTALQWWL